MVIRIILSKVVEIYSKYISTIERIFYTKHNILETFLILDSIDKCAMFYKSLFSKLKDFLL